MINKNDILCYQMLNNLNVNKNNGNIHYSDLSQPNVCTIVNLFIYPIFLFPHNYLFSMFSQQELGADILEVYTQIYYWKINISWV